MVGADVGGPLEPVVGDGVEQGALEGNGAQDPVEGRDPVAGDDGHMAFGQTPARLRSIDVPDLALVELAQALETGGLESVGYLGFDVLGR